MFSFDTAFTMINPVLAKQSTTAEKFAYLNTLTAQFRDAGLIVEDDFFELRNKLRDAHEMH